MATSTSTPSMSTERNRFELVFRENDEEEDGTGACETPASASASDAPLITFS
eukprot:CAMPEP_0171978792 /NCGR_PEP_ID=MMETSP0993-20121228/253860_1 /TAXON_ID=483369 /ORGANISM="non described non described, Strain CCMP2098" /LENGTH=51 /DNA_ID=CAMNT_0012630783 /DNA_START=142 /DNA_END=297 /DNA_ORIENTATION=-